MTEEISGVIFGVWFLIGAALVFWMQAGFAMVEAGFTRAKNTGNILMKNLMDFCIGTVVFILIGFSLLLGEDVLGFIGKPGFDIFTSYKDFDWSNFVFNLVFCATTATIVSGAMAERTKFISYCVYSGVISALIYPIEAHWIWGGGWLSQIGFHDFAGSCAIHMVGGISALVGAAILGPRIGKFTKDKNGNIQTFGDDDGKQIDCPIVVLVDENSASASEVFTGALKDYGKATVVGKKSYGKGIVQSVLPFYDGSGMSLTVAKYYTPNGTCIHGIGIEPDVEVDMPDEYKDMYASMVEHDKDTQLQKAIEIIKEK